MTTPPLPASPCLRVKLDYTGPGDSDLGSRFYLSYAGSPPTAGNCIAIATGVSAAWGSHIADNVQESYALAEVDVLDIASDTGLSGQYSTAVPGTNTEAYLPGSVAVNIEFGIARRYRGGKPRMFIPPPGAGNQTDANHWNSSFTNGYDTAFAAFMAEIEALSIGAVGALAHVNLSYYKGFTNIPNSSGREKAVPTYRSSALVDTVVGYHTKAVIGSQRRRRTSTTY